MDSSGLIRLIVLIIVVVVLILFFLWLVSPPPPGTATPTPAATATSTPTLGPTQPPTQPPTPAPTPYVSVVTGLADLHTGPGLEFPVAFQLGAEMAVPLVSWNEDASWLQVGGIGDQLLWVSSASVMVNNPPADMPPTPAAAPGPTDTPTATPTATDTPTPLPSTPTPTPTSTPSLEPEPAVWSIGKSHGGRDITVYRWGRGSARLLLVGGIHGGYESNTIDLMHRAIEYYVVRPDRIESNVTLYILPSLNPDGEDRLRTDPIAQKTPRVARTNGNGVDLNRNFDCTWQSESMHQGFVVSAGSTPFSEPETAALRNFVAAEGIDALIFYHSQGRWVETGVCHRATERSVRFGQAITDALNEGLRPNEARFAYYNKQESTYPVTGDAPGYFNGIGLTAIAIELTTHDDTEWDIQSRGIRAAVEWAGRNLD